MARHKGLILFEDFVRQTLRDPKAAKLAVKELVKTESPYTGAARAAYTLTMKAKLGNMRARRVLKVILKSLKRVRAYKWLGRAFPK